MSDRLEEIGERVAHLLSALHSQRRRFVATGLALSSGPALQGLAGGTPVATAQGIGAPPLQGASPSPTATATAAPTGTASATPSITATAGATAAAITSPTATPLNTPVPAAVAAAPSETPTPPPTAASPTATASPTKAPTATQYPSYLPATTLSSGAAAGTMTLNVQDAALMPGQGVLIGDLGGVGGEDELGMVKAVAGNTLTLYAGLARGYAVGTPVTTQGKTGNYQRAVGLDVRLYGAKGDGSTDDTAAIKAALSAAAGSSKSVYFPSGTYIINESLAPPADMALIGAGFRRSFLKPGPRFKTASRSRQLIQIAVDRVHVRDLGFLGEGVVVAAVGTSGAADALIERCWFDAASMWSVFFTASSRNCGVVECLSEGTTQAHSIEINNSSYCYVINCHLKNAAQNAIELYLRTPGESVGHRLIGNFLETPGASGFLLDGDSDTTVIGNTVVGAPTAALRAQVSEVLGAAHPSQGGHAVGNTFVNCGGTSNDGVVLDWYSVGWSIKGNTVRGSGNCGITLRGTVLVVEGNTVVDSRRHGIYVPTGGHILTSNVCINNSTSGAGAGDGIRVESPGSSLTGNRCTDTRPSKLQQFGIALIGADANTLSGNATAGNRAVGMYDASAGNIKTGNI